MPFFQYFWHLTDIPWRAVDCEKWNEATLAGTNSRPLGPVGLIRMHESGVLVGFCGKEGKRPTPSTCAL